MGSSLEAQVTIRLSDDDYEFFSRHKGMLNEIFIVSQITLKKGDFSIEVTKASGAKCARCWRWSDSTDADKARPGVCERCAQALREREQPAA